MSTNNNGFNVYQSLDQEEKVRNYSSNPELVYSSITTLSNIIKQVEKEGIGIVFCHSNSSIQTIQKHLNRKHLIVVDFCDLKGNPNHFATNSKVIAVALSSSDVIKISDLQSLVKQMKSSGIVLKWISILKQPSFHQLIKWELK